MEIKALTAREDSCGELVNLRSCKNKDNVGGRLLQSFKERVESLGCEHVYLVDNKDAVFSALGSKGDFFNDFADIVNTAVRGGVHLNNIKNFASVYAFVDFTFTAGLAVLRI